MRRKEKRSDGYTEKRRSTWITKLLRLLIVVLFLLVMLSPLRGCMLADDGLIGARSAIHSACADAGLADSDIKNVGTEITVIGDTVCYLIDFSASGTQYRYVVDATTGKVIAADP